MRLHSLRAFVLPLIVALVMGLSPIYGEGAASAKTLDIDAAAKLALESGSNAQKARETLAADYAKLAARNPLLLAKLSAQGSAKANFNDPGNLAYTGSLSLDIPIFTQLSFSASANLSATSQTYNIGATLSPFATDSTTESILYSIAQDEINLRSVLIDTELSARKAFIAELDSLATLASKSAAVDSKKSAVSRAEAQVKEGQVGRSALYQANSSLASAQRELNQSEKSEFEARAALAALVMISLDGYEFQSLPDFDASLDPESVSLDAVLANSESLALASLKLEQAKKAVATAKAFSPNVSLGASMSLGGKDQTFGFSLNLSVTGADLANSDSSQVENDLAQATRSYEATKADVKRKFESAKLQFSLARRSATQANEALTEAGKSETQSEIQIASGAILQADRDATVLDLKLAQAAAAQAQRALWSAWWDLVSMTK